MSDKESDRQSPFRIRCPELSDAVGITRLIQSCPQLDANSHYACLLLCYHFSSTCLVAVDDSADEPAIVGFVSAYRPPQSDDAVFVWQIGVAESARGQGLAGILLDELVATPPCFDVRFLECTITPSNTPSQKLFRAFARRHDAHVDVRPVFPAEVFPPEDQHEPEDLYRIGPLKKEDTRVVHAVESETDVNGSAESSTRASGVPV